MKDHPQLADVRAIVIEAKDEAAKPAPNKLKLRSILGGIKDGCRAPPNCRRQTGWRHEAAVIVVRQRDPLRLRRRPASLDQPL